MMMKQAPVHLFVNVTGTSSDLSRKVWVTAYKGDTYWAVSL